MPEPTCPATSADRALYAQGDSTHPYAHVRACLCVRACVCVCVCVCSLYLQHRLSTGPLHDDSLGAPSPLCGAFPCYPTVETTGCVGQTLCAILTP